MTACIPCAVSVCGWSFAGMASLPATIGPTDILSLLASNCGDLQERNRHGLTGEQVINAHLATHSDAQWITELLAERQRREDLTADRDRLQIALGKLSFLADTVDPLTTRRLPSRGEVEATRAVLADALRGDGNA